MVDLKDIFWGEFMLPAITHKDFSRRFKDVREYVGELAGTIVFSGDYSLK